MNIYIFIEIKKRELSSRLLLGLEAAKRGHDVYVGDLKPYLKKNLLKPGIVHHKSITPKMKLTSLLWPQPIDFILCTFLHHSYIINAPFSRKYFIKNI